MQATMEKLEPFTPALPVSFILAKYFSKFICYWTKNAEVKYLGEVQDIPVEMPLELSVRWDGNARGTLVIRCFDDFVRWLTKTKGYKPLSFGTGTESLNEMVGLFATYLIHNFWKPELLKIGPILPRPSDQKEWPDRPASAAFCLMVEKHPVEIRFWMEDAG